MKELLIRKAVDADLPAVNEIAREVHELHCTKRCDLYRRSYPVIDKERWEEYQEKAWVLVAETEQKIVGYAVCFIKQRQDIAILIDHQTLFIDAFGVRKACQRQGIGRQLLAAIKEKARDRGCERLELQVMSFNSEALSFYRRLGLREKALILEEDL